MLTETRIMLQIITKISFKNTLRNNLISIINVKINELL